MIYVSDKTQNILLVTFIDTCQIRTLSHEYESFELFSRMDVSYIYTKHSILRDMSKNRYFLDSKACQPQ